MSDFLLEAARSSLGIYPSSVTQCDTTTPRDRYGDGWNDAVTTLTSRWAKLERWYADQTPETRADLDTLFAANCLEVEFGDNETICLSINMNDVFIPAAVSEPIELANVKPLAALYLKYGYDGIYAWMSDRYTCSPRRGATDAAYLAALKDLGRNKA